jgi:hypothetical protein
MGNDPAEPIRRQRLAEINAELQLITGHSRRETLAVYQHVALDGELEMGLFHPRR